MIKHILFDLDGTLLPMVQDEFVRFYMPLLAKSFIQHGLKMDPKEFIKAVWAGYEAMVKNDGTRSNHDAFWAYMDELLPMSLEKSEEITLEFYQGDFNQAICTTNPTPVSNEIVKTAKEKGIEVYLATNPVFPKAATMGRIKWAGLEASDFNVITTYEDCRYCKPNVAYFEELLRQLDLNAAECLMVGNDVEEDLPIRELGVRTYLVTNTMENKKNLPIKTDYMGTLEELLEFVQQL